MGSRPKKHPHQEPLAPISRVRWGKVVELGVCKLPGRVSISPATVVSAKIRKALLEPPIPDVIVYNKKGRPVKRLDGLTRQEKPLGKVKRIRL